MILKNSYEPIIADNKDRSMEITNTIEKRYEIDDYGCEHIETVFHCQRCKMAQTMMFRSGPISEIQY
jgi:hypothetical protein